VSSRQAQAATTHPTAADARCTQGTIDVDGSDGSTFDGSETSRAYFDMNWGRQFPQAPNDGTATAGGDDADAYSWGWCVNTRRERCLFPPASRLWLPSLVLSLSLSL
jgi:hypothetical protein